MSDSEWVREHLKEYHQDDVPPCGTSEEGCMGCMVLLGIIAVAFALLRFVLPHFGIEIDVLEIIRNFLNN